MRRLRVCLIIAPALFALGGSGCAQPPGPSVLLITLDTTRADRLGVYGGPVPTPAYDRLAASGAVFERAYASTPLTTPSHATILTGLSPLSHGVRENGDAALSPEIPTLATRLSEAGWTGAAFTSAFPTRARWGLARGFSLVHDDVCGDSTRDDFGDCRKAALVVDDAISTLSGVEGPVFAWVHARGRVDDAISLAVDLYLRQPSAQMAMKLAELTESTGDLPGALDGTDEAIALEPEQPAAQAAKVRLLLGLGELQAAAVLAERCFGEDPDNLDVALALAELALIRGRPEEAEALALRVLGRLPDSAWARVVLAEAARASGRPEEAIAGLRDALGRNPFNLPVRMRLGAMFLEVGRNAEAVRALEPATALSPDNTLVQRSYADALLALDAELSRSALQRRPSGLPETTP